MTSRLSSERIERTEARRATVRRGLKKRGVLPSFGDMVLPIVGVSAVILLVIFGRQFFLNGLKSSPGITSTKAYAEAPAILAELERKESEAAKLTDSISSDVVAKSEDIKEPEEDLFALAVAVQTQKPVASKPVPVVQTTKKATTSKSSSNAAVKKSAAPAKSSASSNSSKTSSSTVNPKQWRVQIGAYTNRAGAQDAANKIKKAGYNAVVYSNPASKHFKVWVAGGADKRAADNVVKAMQKLGYKSSFSFPPAK